MIRRSSIIALEIVAGLAAAGLIALALCWWRLSQGPVELNFLRQQLQTELSEARSGRPVGVERVELAWSESGGALELRAVGVSIEDGRGHVLSRAEEARIELSVLPLLLGRIVVEEADFSGAHITITRKLDGAMHVAFGPPGAPPDIIIPASPVDETMEQRVARLLDGLEDAFAPVGPGGKLRLVSLRGAQLAIIDEKGGGRWTADDANIQLAREGRALAFVGDARLEGAEGLAPASLRITTDVAFQSAIVEFGAQNVRPRALLSQAALGPFAGLDAPLTATISIGLDRETGINRLEGEATLGRGVADMAGGQFNVSGGRVRGRYDIDSDELIIDQLNLAGARTRINGEVRVRQASAILKADPNAPAAFDVALPSVRLDIPGVLAEPIDLSDVRAVGAIASAERSIRFTELAMRTGNAAFDATGRVYWAEAGADGALHPGVELDGAVAGQLTVQQVLNLWPVKLGEGARNYLARSLVSGRVSEGQVRFDIRPSDMAAGRLRNESLNVRFSIADAEMRYLQTMSPVTGARGRAVLLGNRFDLDIEQASMNNLALTRGRVEIPRLSPKGALATISAHVEGEARNILEVLAQEPLSLSDEIPVDPASASGRGVADITLQRPMLSVVPFEQWRFAVNGRVDNFAGNMTARRVALSQGRLEIRGDQRAISVSGPIRAGDSNVNVAWTETLNRRGEPSSRYQIAGDFDADDLERLGYPVAQYAQGRVGVTVSGEGRGFDVENAHVQLDLRNTAIEAPRAFWTKRAGQAASARFDVTRQPDGSLAFTDIDARGAGLVAQGRVRLSRDNRILEADLPRLAIEGRSDARLIAARAADGGLDLNIRGALWDAAPFMDDAEPTDAAGRAAAASAPPLRATLSVDRLKMRGGATLGSAQVQLTTMRNALATLIAEGRSPGDRPFNLGLGPRPAEPSGRIRFTSADAGFATRALTGAENVVGGAASAEGDWRGGPPSRAQFNVRLRDFEVVRLPAMARLLSSAGSLTGLVEMLNGDGIGFNALDAQVVFANNRVSITEARAAGPSLGLTANGAYDVRRDNLDIDGVVVPSYGLNSMLGALPVLGELFVSRQGEGVVGMTYSINGRVANPRVGVNPLSALTPGILRRIFEPAQPRTRERPAEEAPAAEAPGQGSAAPAVTATASLPAEAVGNAP